MLLPVVRIPAGSRTQLDCTPIFLSRERIEAHLFDVALTPLPNTHAAESLADDINPGSALN